MSSMTLNCPICQGVFQAESAWEGRQVACPHCQAVVMIPSSSPPVGSMPPVDSKIPVPVEPPKNRQSHAEGAKQNLQGENNRAISPAAAGLLPPVFDEGAPFADEPLPLPGVGESAAPNFAGSHDLSLDIPQAPRAGSDLPTNMAPASSSKEVARMRQARAAKAARARKKNFLLAVLAALVLSAAVAGLLIYS